MRLVKLKLGIVIPAHHDKAACQIAVHRAEKRFLSDSRNLVLFRARENFVKRFGICTGGGLVMALCVQTLCQHEIDHVKLRLALCRLAVIDDRHVRDPGFIPAHAGEEIYRREIRIAAAGI